MRYFYKDQTSTTPTGLLLAMLVFGFLGNSPVGLAQGQVGGVPGRVNVTDIGDGFDDIGPIEDVPIDIPTNEFVCVVVKEGVSMKWDFRIIEPFGGWIIWRGDEIVAVLPPSTDHFFDDWVPAGEHTYTLSIVDFFAGPNGGITPIDHCRVSVPHRGLTCRVRENEVFLNWDFPLIDVAFDVFRIRRNGVVIANLSPDQLEYVDSVFAVGKYEYTLSLALGRGTRGEENEIEIGRCDVAVVCFNLHTRVDGLTVGMEWMPINSARIYTITRDGVLVGRTGESSFVDEVPEPGTYVYTVSGNPCPRDSKGKVPCLAPSVIVASCIVRVEGPYPPAPENLECIVAFPIPLPVPDPRPVPQRVDPEDVVDVNVAFSVDDLSDTDGDGVVDSILPRASVILEWRNPVDYDTILIVRDHVLIARLNGSRTGFVDHPGPGRHWYNVIGVLDDRRSPPARCEVQVPYIHFPPPVRELDCEVVDVVPVDHNDPAIVVGGRPDDLLPALPTVVLSWRNPIDYDRILVTRNDGVVSTLPGDATRYADHPGDGKFTYCVTGVLGHFRSRASCCDVVVPPNIVPPVRNLTCAVAIPLPNPVPGPLPIDPITGDTTIDANDPAALDTDDDGAIDAILPRASVFLDWDNPINYSKIVISRDKAIIATLRGHTTSYVDEPGGGKHTYSVVGILEDRRSAPQYCDVEVPPIFIPPPRDLHCELLSTVLDPRDPDNPVDLEAGDRILPPANVVVLRWWNPIRYDRLVVLRNGDELDVLRGSATGYRDINPPPGEHVYGVYGIVGERRTRTVECRVFVGSPLPPVVDLRCIVSTAETDPTHQSVILVWENAARYDGIVIARDNQVLIELEGEARKYIDVNVDPGVYTYCVTAFRGEVRARSVCCQVVIDDTNPRENLLFFTSSLEPSPIDDVLEDPTLGAEGDVRVSPPPSNRITCLANNVEPLQGWSFGVGNDPEFIVPEQADIEGTVTETFNGGEGPAFLFINFAEDGSGVTMAVVISADEDGGVLPVGTHHRLMNITYGSGPRSVSGDVQAVRYTDTLGDPPVQVLFVVEGFEVKPRTAPGFVRLKDPFFMRGDFDNDGRADITDGIEELKWLYLGRDDPPCMEAANFNGTTQINIADPIYLFNWVLLGGPYPPPPSPPDCGFSPAPLGCASSGCDD